MKLSILIPTIKRHNRLFTLLKLELSAQILPYPDQIEVLWDDHETDSTGLKRNRLLERASGKYTVFFDADDKPAPYYIEALMEAVESDCDCASLKGEYWSDGKFDGIFEHSLEFQEWRTNPEGSEVKYIRTINHINMVRADIAKQIKFPEVSWSEDHEWSKSLHASGLLKTEHYIPEVLYYYMHISKK